MTIKTLLIAVGLASAGLAAPALAQPGGPPPGHGMDRPPPGPAYHRPHHGRMVCHTAWRHHHRVRRCVRR